MTRKVIQIAVTQETDERYPQLFALCDDGTLWWRASEPSPQWTRIDDVPQDETVDVKECLRRVATAGL